MQLASDGALISSRRNLAILKRVDIYYEYPIFISKDQQVAKGISVYGRAIKLNHLCQFFPYSLENLVKNQRNCYNNRKKMPELKSIQKILISHHLWTIDYSTLFIKTQLLGNLRYHVHVYMSYFLVFIGVWKEFEISTCILLLDNGNKYFEYSNLINIWIII